MRSRVEMKERSKEILDHKLFGEKWLYALLGVLIVSAILGASSFTFIVPILLIGILMVGMTRAFMGLINNEDEKYNLEKAFSGFSDGKVGEHLALGAVSSIFIALWSLLFVIPGIVKSYSYAMSYVIQIKEPKTDIMDCITKSREIMNGHKMELFILDLSFLGWYILGILCLGIGILWVEPYHQLTRTQFLMELYEESEGVVVVSE